jgi:hypothetical protein
MLGMTGHRMCNKGALNRVVMAPQNLANIQFPQMTVVRSMQLIDDFGRPTYRKDIHVV